MKKPRAIFSVVLIILLLFSNICFAAENTVQNKKDTYDILVDLTELRLYLINKDTNKVFKSYPIAGGKTSTPSPIGTWVIIGRAKNWGKGFGTRWLRLGVPWGQFGIHGTNKPLTIGGAESLGCIRMYNKDVEDLYNYVGIGTTVVIYGGSYGLDLNIFRTLGPGDRGADVCEVQRRMQQKGYFSGKLNGIYEEDMKSEVIRFRKDNKLQNTHIIDKEFYDALQIKPFE